MAWSMAFVAVTALFLHLKHAGAGNSPSDPAVACATTSTRN